MSQAIDKNGLEAAARAAYDNWIEPVRDLEPAWENLPEDHKGRLMDSIEAALDTFSDDTSPQPQAHEAEPSPAAQPVARWDGWRPVATAPEDEGVILCTSGGHVGEALMLRDEDTGEQKWTWASGPVSKFHAPLGWQPLPSAIDKPVADLGATGFDGPTGAE